MSSTTTQLRSEEPIGALRSAGGGGAVPTGTTGNKRASSLALPSSLFPNQSRPSTTPSRSEHLTTVAPSSLDSKSSSKSFTKRPSFKGLPPRFRRSRKQKHNKMANSVMKNGGPPENVLQWLEACCPKDVAPKVLAFCGPQTTSALMATNRYWFQLIAQNDATWRSLCEGLYKWREGQDELPTTSWKEYYRLHPCVPVDYPNIPRALAVATATNKNSSRYNISSSRSSKDKQIRSVQILLRPGRHFVKESLLIAAAPDVTVTMKTMELPENRFYSPRLALLEQAHPQSFPEPSKSKSRNTTLKQWMGCKSMPSVVESGSSVDSTEANNTNVYDSDSSDNSVGMANRPRAASLSTADAARIQILATSPFLPPPKYPTRATLVLQTRRINEPVVKVKQGAFELLGMDLDHASQGVDIWNGNAAIQVQPPLGADNEPLPVTPKPSARLENVAISSKSGRGVVCLDGGSVTLQDCMIYDCAATGLYVGGPGSQADIARTDVIRNGIGSRLPPSRLPRVTSGHSGVYLEQGLARVNECNISSNYLTGISAVSFEKAFLHLSKSDLVANGQGNLEVPPPGTVSYDKSDIANDNNLASVGRPCLRSNLELPARARARASF